MSATMTAAPRFYLVDALNYIHRAYHVMPPLTHGEEPVGALLGFTRMLYKLAKHGPEYMAVCFDAPGPTFRHKLFADYKATREETPEDLRKQIASAEEMVRAMGIPLAKAAGYEADDLMATLARKALAEGLDVVLVTDDKDAMQLVGKKLRVLRSDRKGGEVFFDSAKVEDRYAVRPEQMVDFLTLVGDSSDNVPGVPGIGEKGAAKLLKRFGTLEKLMAAARAGHADIPPKAAKTLVENADGARKSRELIVLDDRAPVEFGPGDCRLDLSPNERLIALLGRFGFRTLLAEMGAGRPQEPAADAPEPPDDKTWTIALRETPAKAWLAAARKAKVVALAVAESGQPDLLHEAGPVIGLALSGGRAATFADAEFSTNREALKRLLADAGVGKIGHDLKSARRILRRFGFELEGPLEDTMLAAYCLNPSRSRFTLEAVLRDAGGPALKEEEPQLATARRAAAAWPLSERLGRELKAGGLAKLYRELELPLLRVLAEMEDAGVAVDAAHLKAVGRSFSAQSAALKAEIDALAGFDINPNSSKQLAQLFFEKLGLPVVHKTAKGAASTDEEALRALAARHPIPAKIIEFRELSKLNSTYVDGLLARIDPGSKRVHSHFNQTGTQTGRLSSTDPNLQNIPVRTPHGREIRKAFIATRGQALLAADYSQIDLRVLAHLSEDEALCAAFARGDDIHRQTAGEVFGVAPEKVDREMRRRAKAVNFGIVYGQGAHGLSTELGIPFGEARAVIAAYFARYRGVERWLKSNLEEARAAGKVSTLLGRVRFLPELGSRAFRERSFAERVANNTPIQGSSADIIKAAMINIHAKCPGRWKARLVLQVHDELVFELPKGEVAGFGAWVREEMETAVRLRVPVVVDVKAGADWDSLEILA